MNTDIDRADPERGHPSVPSRPSAHMHLRSSLSGASTIASLDPHQSVYATGGIDEKIFGQGKSDVHHQSDTDTDQNLATPENCMNYLEKEAKRTKDRTKRWAKVADGVLTFTGLFAVVLVTLLLITYPLLQPDKGDKTNQLLTQITQQLPLNGTQQFPLSRADESNDPPFRPHNYALRVNAMWLTSLSVTLSCALWATLVQQWARGFYPAADAQFDKFHEPLQRAQVYYYFSDSVDKSALPVAVDLLPGLLHISLLPFFIGLIDLLFNVNHTLAYIILAKTLFGFTTYLYLTFISFIDHDSPYHTPLSLLLWFAKELSILLWLLAHPWRNRELREAIRARSTKIWKGWRRNRVSKTISLISQDKAKIEGFRLAITSLDEDHE